jgi:hypothetical protein
MKKNRLPALAASIGLSIGTDDEAESIAQYSEVRSLLLSGVPMLAIFSPSECRRDGSDAAEVVSSMSFVSRAVWIRDLTELDGNTLTFCGDHLTMEPGGSCLRELIRYTLKEDNSATIEARVLSPVNYSPLGKAVVFSSNLGFGLRLVCARINDA